MARHDCEDAIICDFAEYYNIYNYESLPPSYAAVLLYGLPPDSRVMRHYSKEPATTEIMLLASIADSLNFIAWSKTKDAEKGKNRPARIIDELYNKNDKKKDDISTFSSPEDYEATRRAILERIQNG